MDTILIPPVVMWMNTCECEMDVKLITLFLKKINVKTTMVESSVYFFEAVIILTNTKMTSLTQNHSYSFLFTCIAVLNKCIRISSQLFLQKREGTKTVICTLRHLTTLLWTLLGSLKTNAIIHNCNEENVRKETQTMFYKTSRLWYLCKWMRVLI